ncbi:MAG TPA: YciI family protein [Gemmatimonadaceae bacterium]|nr:YciI family protein [Gemmatimonadaceae bacterium]
MRFLSIYKAPETNTPPSPELVEKMGKLVEESMKAGELIATEGCLPSAFGARVRLDRGNVTVTDGPFTESKELIAGFALLEARSKAEAIEMARRFLSVVGGGECEIRQVHTGEVGDGADAVGFCAPSDVPMTAA